MESHPGINIESMYSEAVLAYNKKQSDAALKLLDNLLAASPNHVEGLELMALTLKDKGNDAKAVDIYNRLLKIKPANERGPYHFELGMIYQKQKKPKLAQAQFEQAARLDFNRATSHLFLGLINFDAGNLNAAEADFNQVTSKGAPEMKMLAHYYLGLIHFKNGYGAGGTHELTAARNLARDIPNNKMASDIAAGADRILAPFNTDQWFGNITFLGEYDSNIGQLPTGIAASSSSKKATPNMILNGGAGYMSSPTQAVQWVGNYRFSFNKTPSADTRAYEYFGHTPALYLNFNPLSRTTGGLKAEGNLTFSNQLRDPAQPNGSWIFRKYTTYLELGPYFKYELAKNLQSEFETSYRKVTNDPSPDQSGNLLHARGGARSTSTSNLLNPGASITWEKFSAEGRDYRTSSVDFGIANMMKLTGTDTVNLSADLTLTKYPETLPQRSDQTLTGRVSYLHTLSRALTVLGEATYTNNNSNQPDSNAYNRFAFGAGVGWTL